MATIHTTDTIMASATRLGKTLATVNATGFTSFTDVINDLRKKTGAVAGMISINLRNFSQGWTEKRTLYITTSQPSGVQLSLF